MKKIKLYLKWQFWTIIIFLLFVIPLLVNIENSIGIHTIASNCKFDLEKGEFTYTKITYFGIYDARNVERTKIRKWFTINEKIRTTNECKIKLYASQLTKPIQKQYTLGCRQPDSLEDIKNALFCFGPKFFDEDILLSYRYELPIRDNPETPLTKK